MTPPPSEFYPAADDDELVALLLAAGCTEVMIRRRRVHRGELRAIRSCDPPNYEWHLSMSYWPSGHRARRRVRRLPTWDELMHARYELLPHNIDVVMLLPPASAEFVNANEMTFHLHEFRREAS